MRTREEIIWAAGFFEGEGSFNRRQIYAGIHQVDREPLERFQTAVGFGKIYGPTVHGKSRPIYIWRVGTFERVQALLAMLWPWLSVRRRAQGVESISCRGRLRRGVWECIHGHPYTPENTNRTRKRSIYCRACKRGKGHPERHKPAVGQLELLKI